jgi:translocation and assembly module TamB
MTLDAQQLDASPDVAASLSAKGALHPWRKQPAQQVDLQMSHLNAHAFVDMAPVTSLRGRVSLEPQAGTAAWSATIELGNDQPDAWNRQRLPVRQLSAQAALSLEQLDIATASIELGSQARAGVVRVQGQVPLRELLRSRLQVDLQQVDLRPLMTTLPRTSLNGQVTVEPFQQGRRIRADLRNAAPGPLDVNRLPMSRLLADARQDVSQWRIETFDAQVGSGLASLRADFAPSTRQIDLKAQLQGLPLRQIHSKMALEATTRVSGTLAASGTPQQGIAFQADVRSDAPGARPAARSQWEIRALETSGRWSPTRLVLDRVHVDAFQATVDGKDIDVSLPRLDSIKANISGAAPGAKLLADAAMSAQTGGGKVSLQLTSAEQLLNWMRGLPLIGSQLPELRARGAASLDMEWQGTWRQWVAGFANPASQPRLRIDAVAHSEGLAVNLPATAARSALRLDVRKLDLSARGNLASAAIAIESDALANDTRTLLEARARSTQSRGSGGRPRWNIAVEKFDASATLPAQSEPWRLQLSDNLQISMQTGQVIDLRAAAGTATLTPPQSMGAADPLQVTWQPVTWHRTAGGAMTLQSAGNVSGIQPEWLDTLLAKKGEGPLTAAGVRTDLVLSGDWDVRLTDRVLVRANLKRERGDLAMVDSASTAGIRALDVTLQASDENVSAALNWDTENAGAITARIGTRLRQQAGGWSLPPDSPLSGSVQARLQDLSTWAFLAPPGWRIQGELDADLRLAGTVQKPQLDGGVNGNNLNLRSVLDGLDLNNGTLRARLQDSRMQISELTFEGGTGSRAYVRGFSGNRTSPPKERGRMTARGYFDWSRLPDPTRTDPATAQSRIVMNLEAELQAMQVLVRNDRQMTLSGQLSANLDEGALRVRGDLKVDRASIVLPEASAPTLGDDVVINRGANLRNAGAVEARQARVVLETRKPMDMEVKLDLGRDLALEGQGITTRLEGDLTVRSATGGSEPFRVFGEVRTVEGRYRAWGQALDIETGIVRFNGPYGNPILDLLAIRPKIEVRAGVRVTGTLLAPRVKLFSEPDLPEGEKLSWIVLGRATVITGAEGSSMQQAALGLAAGQLGGRLASGLGLDELGLSEAGVSVGKRISNELYLTYQQGLAGAASTLFIFYDITRRLTLRAQASEASALDLIYTIKYD